MGAPFTTRKFVIVDDVQRNAICQLARNVPAGIEVIFRQEQKQRKAEQNALMWAALLTKVSKQAWVNGRQFDNETWHEYFKKKFLPEEFEDGYTLDGYRKWKFLPDGSMSMVGSTTRLTTKGFARYLEEVEAYCTGELGVSLYEREEMYA